MRGRGFFVVLFLVCGVIGVGPAAAAPAAPHFVDPCGVESVAAHPTDGATTPSTDICNGWFSTLSGPSSGLRVTLTFADEIDDDRFGHYSVQWQTSGCRYQVVHDKGLGHYGSGGFFVNDPGGDWLHVNCGTPVTEPCGPLAPATMCTTYPSTRSFPLTDATAVDGKVLSLNVAFDGPLEILREEMGTGTRLSNAYAVASTKVGLATAHPGYCWGAVCGSLGGDVAAARSTYTVGE